MNTINWSDILRLLTVVTLAPGQIYPEKIDCFVHNVLALRDVIDPDVMFTSAMAFDWYKLNQEDIKKMINRPTYTRELGQLIYKIGRTSAKAPIIEIIDNLVNFDAGVHPKEKEILDAVRFAWLKPNRMDLSVKLVARAVA